MIVTQGVANLVVEVVTETGKQPTGEATVLVYSNGRLVDLGSTYRGEYSVYLTSGYYDIGIVYPENEYSNYYYHIKFPPLTGNLRKDVAIVGGISNTITFTIPTESYLAAVVYTKNGALAQKYYETFITSDGQDIAEGYTGASDPTRFILRADVSYDVTIQYDGEELKKKSIILQDGMVDEVKFWLPYDEGNVNIVLRSRNDSLPEDATVSILDANGNEIESWQMRDEFNEVLHADLEYTILVKYKDQPAQEKIFLVRAGETIEMKFTFLP